MVDFLLQVAFLGLDPLLCLLIGEPAIAMDDGAPHPVLTDIPLVIHVEHHGKAELIFQGS